MATKKRFKLAADKILPIVKGMGGCIASDKITVGGEPVAYMVRSETERPGDSGWLFTSGTETQAYMDEAANFEVYDVNTIANYDSDIVPFLHAPPGSSYERPGNTGAFGPLDDTEWMPGDAPYRGKWPPPGFPIVEGRFALSKNWMLALPEQYARRVEDGSLVLWRPGITLWINAWGNDRGESQAARLAAMTAGISTSAREIQQGIADRVTRFSYLLTEDNQDALYAFAFSDAGHLQMAIYFDDPADASTARAIALSVTAL
ncbi:MAG: DUF2185 domain-containing protein [Polyangiales bacterium]